MSLIITTGIMNTTSSLINATWIINITLFTNKTLQATTEATTTKKTVSVSLTGLFVFISVLVVIFCLRKKVRSSGQVLIERKWSMKRKIWKIDKDLDIENDNHPRSANNVYEERFRFGEQRMQEERDWRNWVDENTKCCIEKELYIDWKRLYIHKQLGRGKTFLVTG